MMQNANNGVKNIREKFAKIQQIRAEILKKTEELKRSIYHDMDKMEIEITKSKDLAIESKERLRSEIFALKNEVEEKYADLKRRVSEVTVPL
jgi:bisphosphoglycerate-dependent phosphoglycerate mutase